MATDDLLLVIAPSVMKHTRPTQNCLCFVFGNATQAPERYSPCKLYVKVGIIDIYAVLTGNSTVCSHKVVVDR